MIRLTALSLALLALVPLAPPGCPSQTSPVETQPTERGTLATTAEAPASTTVGETVTLHASANAAEGVVSYSWLQTAGPGVQIGAADQPAAQFVAPSLSKESTLRFMVTTSDDTGAVGRAEVQIAYVIGVELASMLLLAGLVGAYHLGRQDKG